MILAFVLTAIAAVVLTLGGVVGSAMLIVFGDALVFGLIIWGIVKLFKKK
jgi:hypothetical protein